MNAKIEKRSVFVVVKDKELEESNHRHEIAIMKYYMSKHMRHALKHLEQLGVKVVDNRRE